jgi:hypothetical protein
VRRLALLFSILGVLCACITQSERAAARPEPAAEQTTAPPSGQRRGVQARAEAGLEREIPARGIVFEQRGLFVETYRIVVDLDRRRIERTTFTRADGSKPPTKDASSGHALDAKTIAALEASRERVWKEWAEPGPGFEEFAQALTLLDGDAVTVITVDGSFKASAELDLVQTLQGLAAKR